MSEEDDWFHVLKADGEHQAIRLSRDRDAAVWFWIDGDATDDSVYLSRLQLIELLSVLDRWGYKKN